MKKTAILLMVSWLLVGSSAALQADGRRGDRGFGSGRDDGHSGRKRGSTFLKVATYVLAAGAAMAWSADHDWDRDRDYRSDRWGTRRDGFRGYNWEGRSDRSIRREIRENEKRIRRIEKRLERLFRHDREWSGRYWDDDRDRHEYRRGEGYGRGDGEIRRLEMERDDLLRRNAYLRRLLYR